MYVSDQLIQIINKQIEADKLIRMCDREMAKKQFVTHKTKTSENPFGHRTICARICSPYSVFIQYSQRYKMRLKRIENFAN